MALRSGHVSWGWWRANGYIELAHQVTHPTRIAKPQPNTKASTTMTSNNRIRVDQLLLRGRMATQ